MSINKSLVLSKQILVSTTKDRKINDLPAELYDDIIVRTIQSHDSINYLDLQMNVNSAHLDEALQTLVASGILIHWKNNDNYGTTALGKRISRNGGYALYINNFNEQNKSAEQRIKDLEVSTIESNRESVKQTAIQKKTYYVALAALVISIIALLSTILSN